MNILVIGSSSIGELGRGTLGQALRPRLQRAFNDAIVTFDGRDSRGLSGNSANRLVGTQDQRTDFNRLLEVARPHLILVVLGGNPSGTPEEILSAMYYVRNVGAAVGAKVYWVGPPRYAANGAQTVTDLFDVAGPIVFGENYHSSQSWTHPTSGRTADRVHLTQQGADAWANYIMRWLDSRHRSRWPLWVAAVAALGAGITFYLRRPRRRASLVAACR